MSNLTTDFRLIGQFNGRERRKQFWPYAAVSAFIYLLVSQLAMLPFMSQMMSSMFTAMLDPKFVNAAQSDNPLEMQAMVFQMMPDMGALSAVSGGVLLLFIVLIGAAVSRRLHDSGLSGYWGLLPLPFHLIGLAISPMMLSSFKSATVPDTRVWGLMMLNNALAFCALAALIILLCRASSPDENDYGPEPV